MGNKDIKILICDDDFAFAKFISKFLALEINANVEHVTNPKLAFEKLKVNKYDLLILDMEMPVMDGYTALKTIRDDLKITKMPVIVCSGLVNPTLIAGLSKLKIDAYIAKPSKANIILEKVKKSLKILSDGK